MVLKPRVLLLTPPFTQLNTPYPATCYLKGYLRTLGVESRQADLGIEVICSLFSEQGLRAMFHSLGAAEDVHLDEDSYRLYALRHKYVATIEPVISFLQNKNPTLAHRIADRLWLPEGRRFRDVQDLEWAFGHLGIQDQARHICTLYLEDLGDFITAYIDPHFGFSRYAERLGRTATHFDPLMKEIENPDSLISVWMNQSLENHIALFQPTVVGVTIPFPGNLLGAFKCGRYIRTHHPHIKIIFGGGYVNTELRSLEDPRIFDYTDFICLDDGEAPLKTVLEHLAGERDISALKRCFVRQNGQVKLVQNRNEKDVAQRETGTPDYSDLPLHQYLSVIEITNPMHRLWSDGRWNKLTLAHGCYWGKCSFCDISLDYIQRYEPLTAALLADRIEELITQTGETGFHFVDEAAPPALLRDLAIELLRRNRTISWWANIRFEEKFTPDLCRLLKASGCIAVSGGLEVASDRLLHLMKKGVTVAQVARVSESFTRAGIMVHAYLMYGFPTQSDEETIDSLEMVRQLFQEGIIQSGFWHLFAMTAHSPVGLQPAAYKVIATGPKFGGFAHNDLYHEDPTGASHEMYSEGLRLSLYNYMNELGLDKPLQHWFHFDVPATRIEPDFIATVLSSKEPSKTNGHYRILWIGGPVEHIPSPEDESLAYLTIYGASDSIAMELESAVAHWIEEMIHRAAPLHNQPLMMSTIIASFTALRMGSWEDFQAGPLWELLRQEGLLIV